jgi:hypothetical protein
MFMKKLVYGNNGEEVVLLQRALNELLGKSIKTDGDYGKITEELVRIFQRKNKLEQNGIYGDKERTIIEPLISKKYLRYSEIDTIANKARLPVNVIKAIRVVEARGAGFLPDGRTIILFERHKFYNNLISKFGIVKADQVFKLHPSICNPLRGGYKGNEAEYPRIELAMKFDTESALRSASFGLFQIMGFNFKSAGYSTVEAFVNAMKQSEKNHLSAVISFIKTNRRLKEAVETSNFDKIAEYYNGVSYRENNYHIKLANAAKKFS